jgi:hypothetical protein
MGVGAATLVAGALACAWAQGAAADTNRGTVNGVTYLTDAVVTIPAGTDAHAEAKCPAGTHVAGGGISVGNGGSLRYVYVNASEPFDGSDANSELDDGWSGTVRNASAMTAGLQVFAMCRTADPDVASSSHHVTAGQSESLRVNCPSHTHVTGGGASIFGATGQGYLNSTYPVDGSDSGTKPDDGWKSRTFNVTGSGKSMDAFAICEAGSAPQYETTTLSLPVSTDVGFDLDCPAATALLSAGMQITGDSSQAHLTGLVPEDSPSDADTSPDDYGLFVSYNETSTKSETPFSVCV